MFEKLLSLLGLKRQREDSSILPPTEHSPFECPICSDYIINCVVTSCGHIFCEYCLNQSLIYSHCCPICRKVTSINSYNPIKSIDSQIRSNLNRTQQKKYEKRLESFLQWREAKKLKKSKVGMKIDALDTEGIWCVALIRLKIDNGDLFPQLYIHYIGWDKSYDEIIPENSKRLAPLGFYTSKNIPRYRNMHNDE